MPLPQQDTNVEPIAVMAPVVRLIVPRPSPASRYANNTPSDGRNEMSETASPNPSVSTPVRPILVPAPVTGSIVMSTLLPVDGSRPTPYSVPSADAFIALTRWKPIAPTGVDAPVAGSIVYSVAGPVGP